ncbi:MAG: hypothetical protein KDA33_03070 [Phycisphaerales bacterium]|nr:hypothetical protein [Phycisphaerales bacterium]
MNARNELILNAIREAFPTEDPPRGHALFATEVIDSEIQQFIDNWDGQRWDEVTPEFLDGNENSHAYIYFTPRAYVYYLPALLADVACAETPSGSMFVDHLISEAGALAHAKRGVGDERGRRRWRRLAPRQVEVILMVLRYCADAYDAEPEFDAKQRKKLRKRIEALELT